MRIKSWLNSSEEFLAGVTVKELVEEFPGLFLSSWGDRVTLKQGDSKAIFVFSKSSMGKTIDDVKAKIAAQKNFTLRKGGDEVSEHAQDDYLATIVGSKENRLDLSELL